MIDTLTLTEKQATCLEPAINRIITAGAGSGKTFILVNRILGLISGEDSNYGPVNLESIVALTFTKKAAGEMKTRIYRELLRRLQKEDNPEIRRRLTRAKDYFHSANIDTIHGFATGLIRSRPIELGIDPDFQIPEEIDLSNMVKDSVNRTLDDLWRRSREDIKSLTDHMNVGKIKSVLNKLVKDRAALEETIRTRNNTDPIEFIRSIQESKWRDFKKWLGSTGHGFDALGNIRRRCEDILNDNIGKKSDKNQKLKAQRYISEFIDPITHVLEVDGPEDFQYDSIDKFQLTLKDIGRMQNWPDYSPKEFIDKINEFVFPWFLPLERDLEALEVIDSILSIAKLALDDLNQRKYERSIVAFDDMILLARELSSNSTVGIPHRGAYFLIDEFQDTDPIQWDIIRNLSCNDSRTPVRLFLVGDTKQSIYGFRGADHTVSRSAKAALGNQDQNIEVILDENFRSTPGVLAFTNALFNRLFTQAAALGNPYEARAQSLAPMRDQEEGPSGNSSVNFLAYETGVKRRGDSEQWKAEAKAVAGFLCDIRDNSVDEFQNISKLFDSNSPAIGILFRSHSSMEPYMEEFRKNNLNFTVYRGRSFFETPEASALMNLLAWLGDEGNDVALVGLLRSLMFNWKDQEIAAIRLLSHPGNHFWEQLKTHMESPNLQDSFGFDPLNDIKKLSSLKRMVNHLSLTETIRVAIDMTMAHFTLEAAANTGQALPNVEKFIDLVRKMEKVGHTRPLDSYYALKEIAESAKGEAEADTSASEEASIQLMTIHSAKGLEFPMIIIACNSRRTSAVSRDFATRICVSDPQKPDIIARKTLCAIDWPFSQTETENKPTIMSKFLDDHAKAQQEAEEKRLLYVALTRARDKLLIPMGLIKGKLSASAGTHGDLILKALPELEKGVKEENRELEIDGASLTIFYYTDTESTTRPGQIWDKSLMIENINNLEIKGGNAHPLTLAMPYPRNMRVTVTNLMTFSKCPRRFYLERFFPTGRFTTVQTSEEPEDVENYQDIDATLNRSRILGNLVHWIMERHESKIGALDQELNTLGDLKMEGFQELAQGMILAHGLKDEWPSIEKDILRHVNNVASSEILKDSGPESPSKPHTMREASFEMDLDGFSIVGKIDRLGQSSSDEWIVWDYKTNSLLTRTKEQIVREERYDLQVRIYSWAATRILRTPVSAGALVFTGAHEPLFWVDGQYESVDDEIREILDQISSRLDSGLTAFETRDNKDHVCLTCPCCDYGLC